MSEKYPNDIVLQDQVGSRSWLWNFNPLEPNFACGNDGMLSLSMEERRTCRSAENGYDRVLNFETMICGRVGHDPARHNTKPDTPSTDSHKENGNSSRSSPYLGTTSASSPPTTWGISSAPLTKSAAALAFGYAMSYYWHETPTKTRRKSIGSIGLTHSENHLRTVRGKETPGFHLSANWFRSPETP